MVDPIAWQDSPSTLTPITAANLKRHDAWMTEQVTAALGYANAAQASAEEAAAPADDAVAALVANPASGTTAQLAARYLTPRPGLVAWREARDAMSTTPARILCLGDSITEGVSATVATRWSAVLSSLIAARYSVPTSTTGHVPAYFGTVTSPFTKTSATNADDFGITADNTALLGATTGKLAGTFTGTSLKVYYTTGATTVAFTVWVDGAQVGGAYGGSTASIVDGNVATVAMGANTSHTVEIRAGAGVMFITGVAVFAGNEATGLQMFNAGASGATVASIAEPASVNATAATWQQAYRATAPHLVIVMLGANDYAAATTLTTYQGQLDAIVANVRGAVLAAQPQPSILFVTPPKINVASSAQWDTYVHALRTAATRDGTSEFFDLGALMPDIGSPAGNASGYYADTTHPTALGHARIAQILDRILADAVVA